MQQLFKILIGTWAMLCLTALQAQPFRHFGIKEGLPTNTVYRVTQDSDGFIWICHNKGISRFNGSEFIHFTTAEGLPSNDIWLIDIDKQNRVWFFTKANRLGYIYKDKIFTFGNEDKLPFYPQNIYKTSSGLGFYSLQPGESAYYYFDKDKWKALESNVKNLSVVDIKRKYFLINKLNSIQITDSIGRNMLSIPSDVPFTNPYLNQINDSLFVVFSTHKTFYINTRKWTYKSFYFESPIEIGRLTSNETQIQISGKGQLMVFDLAFNLINLFRTNPSVNETFNFMDKDGNLWSASVNDGLYYFPTNLWNTRVYFEGKKIKKVILFNESLFVYPEEKGLLQKSATSMVFNEVLPPLESSDIRLIDEGKTLIDIFGKRMWIFDKTASKKLKQIDAGIFIKSLTRYKKQWFGVGQANFKLTDDLNKIQNYFPYDAADQIEANATHLYMGGINGLKIFIGQSFDRLNTKDSLSTKNITLLHYQDAELMWIGTEKNGLFLTNGQASKLVLDTKGKKITSLFRENEQSLWVIADDDLYYLRSYDFWQKGVSQIDLISSPHPLTGEVVNSVAVLKDSLYLGTNKGLFVLPKNDIFLKPSPKFYIDAVAYNQQSIFSDTVIPYQKNGMLTARLKILDFNPTGQPDYQYRLTPFGDNWQSIENGQLAITGLEPALYTLDLRTANLPEQTQTFTFYIKPLWWQTTLSKVIGLLLLLLLTSFWVGIWVKKTLDSKNKKLESLRQQTEHELHALRSQMNPHFIFNSLNAIQYYLNEKGPELSEKYLIDFSQLIRMIFEYSSKKNISLAEEIKLLKSYLELEKMRFGDKLTYVIDVDEKIPLDQWEIPSLLIQPLIENAVNHGIFHSPKIGLIELRFLQTSPKSLEIIIQDNGVGMSQSKSIYENSVHKTPSKSTDIMKNRMALINQTGRFQIDCKWEDVGGENQSGTRVVLTIKYPNLVQKSNANT